VIAEDPPDVLGQVREEVARIFVPADATAGQLDLEPVCRSAPIGVDQPAEQVSWVRTRYVDLPVDELDPPHMLPAWTVLREDSRPQGTRGDEPYEVLLRAVAINRDPRHDAFDRGLRGVDDACVARVEGDHER
jgi:hypothetical protein